MGSYLKQAFSESDGTGSTMRLMVSLIVFVYMLGWLSVVLRTGTLPAIGATDVITLLGALGWKYAQKGKEAVVDVKCDEVN